MKTQITILLMILSAFAAQAAPSSPSVDEAKSWFEEHYAPEFSSCVMESGRIVPLWANAQMTADGLSVPILTEKKTEFKLRRSDDSYSEVQKSLMVTRNRKGAMSIVIRCIIGDETNGLVADADINTHELIALRKVKNSRVVFREKDLDRECIDRVKVNHIYSRYGERTFVGKDPGTYKQVKVFGGSKDYAGDADVMYADNANSNGRNYGGTAIIHRKAYERPEIQSILKEYSLRARKSD